MINYASGKLFQIVYSLYFVNCYVVTTTGLTTIWNFVMKNVLPFIMSKIKPKNCTNAGALKNSLTLSFARFYEETKFNFNS